MKPSIIITTLKGIKLTIFTNHIIFLQDAPNGCLIHLSNGEMVDTRLNMKQVCEAMELVPTGI